MGGYSEEEEEAATTGDIKSSTGFKQTWQEKKKIKEKDGKEKEKSTRVSKTFSLYKMTMMDLADPLKMVNPII